MSAETLDCSQETTPENGAERAVSPELLVSMASQFHESRELFISVAMKHVKNVHDAQDVVSSAWIKVQKAAASYDPSRPFLPWAVVIVTNAAKAFRNAKYGFNRTQKGMQELTFTDLSSSLHDVRFDAEMKPPENLPSHVTPELMLRVQLKVDSVLGVMNPRVQKMMQRYISGESMGQVSEDAGVNPSTAYVYLHRFRKEMRRVVQEDENLFADLHGE